MGSDEFRQSYSNLNTSGSNQAEVIHVQYNTEINLGAMTQNPTTSQQTTLLFWI